MKSGKSGSNCMNAPRKALFTAAAAALLLFSLSEAPLGQEFFLPGGDLLTADARLSLSVFHPGSSGYLALVVDISGGWHINSNEPLEEFLIPTELEISAPAGIEVVRVLYPEPSLEKLEISDGMMSLYQGRVHFGALLRIGKDVQPGEYRISAALEYQGCNNIACIEPSSFTAETVMTVATPDMAVERRHPEIFSASPFVDEAGRPEGAGKAGEESLGVVIAERGLLLSFLLIFIGGLALNLTPCIYPLIPITVSYFGGQAGGRASRAFLLAIVYVLGMSITYSVLGMIAATTGSLFGSALQNPLVVAFIAAVLVALAMSMFGFWELRMPSFLTRRTGTAKQGYFGALFMGLTVGIVAAPCIGPFVLGLLTYVGEKGRPVLGFFMFFTLAWGMGIPFIVLGTLSGSVSRLPRSGDWMVWVRKIFGFILVAMALYFARHLIGDRLTYAGYGAIALTGGIYLGWLAGAAVESRRFSIIRKAVGLTGIAIAAFFVLVPGGPLRSGAGMPGIDWTAFTRERLAEAAGESKPVIIDFTADWCLPCHELARKTFSDREVMKTAKGFETLRVDLTREEEQEKSIKKAFGIRGVPTIIFIDRTGKEVEELRATGFIEAADMRRRMERLFKAAQNRES